MEWLPAKVVLAKCRAGSCHCPLGHRPARPLPLHHLSQGIPARLLRATCHPGLQAPSGHSYSHGCHHVATRLHGVAGAELCRCGYRPLAESTGHLGGAPGAGRGDPGSALPDHRLQLPELAPGGRCRDPSLICPRPLCKPEALSSRVSSSRDHTVRPFGP